MCTLGFPSVPVVEVLPILFLGLSPCLHSFLSDLFFIKISPLPCRSSNSIQTFTAPGLDPFPWSAYSPLSAP